MLTELSPSEIAALVAENQSLKAENEDMKQSINTIKGVIANTLIEFGIVDEKLQAQKLNKFKLAKKVGGMILSAMDGENTPFLYNIKEAALPLIEKYKNLDHEG